MLPTQFWAKPLYATAPLLCIVVLTISSCAGPSPRERQQARLLAKLDSSLKRDQTFIKQQTSIVLNALENRTQDPQTSEKAKIWLPVTKVVNNAATETISQIDGIIQLLDKELAYTLFIKGDWSDSLYQLLSRFRETSLHADERLLGEFDNTITPHSGFSAASTNNDTKKGIRNGFVHLTNNEAKALLHSWQKEVALTANRLITFCLNQTSSSFCNLELVSSLVAQSHSVLAPGETLTISAGIGYFSYKAKPTIYINGQIVSHTDDPVALYKLKVGKEKGRFTIPVTIKYLNPNGAESTQTTSIEYRVQ